MATIGEQRAWLIRLLRALDMACWRNAEEGRNLYGWATAADVAREINPMMDGRGIFGGLHALQRTGWVEIGDKVNGHDLYAPTERAAAALLRMDTAPPSAPKCTDS